MCSSIVFKYPATVNITLYDVRYLLFTSVAVCTGYPITQQIHFKTALLAYKVIDNVYEMRRDILKRAIIDEG